jgi:hypothetical protein
MRIARDAVLRLGRTNRNEAFLSGLRQSFRYVSPQSLLEKPLEWT